MDERKEFKIKISGVLYNEVYTSAFFLMYYAKDHILWTYHMSLERVTYSIVAIHRRGAGYILNVTAFHTARKHQM